MRISIPHLLRGHGPSHLTWPGRLLLRLIRFMNGSSAQGFALRLPALVLYIALTSSAAFGFQSRASRPMGRRCWVDGGRELANYRMHHLLVQSIGALK